MIIWAGRVRAAVAKSRVHDLSIMLRLGESYETLEDSRFKKLTLEELTAKRDALAEWIKTKFKIA